MIAKLQIATCLAALGCLLAGTARSGPSIAELPLRTSVLAKPNVIFGMDDSGSMDWETMLDSTEGFLWMDTSTAPPTSWNANGTPIRDLGNGLLGHKYSYVFPIGIAAGAQSSGCSNHSFTATVGGARYGFCNPTGGFGMVAPPIPALAALRSARFNPLYYNPSVTYKPWPPAFHDGALRTYAQANASAAQASPQFSASTTLNLAATVAANTNLGHHFFAHPGHRLPVGTRICSNTNAPCTSWNAALTSEYTLTSGDGSRFVAVPYYPATYWQLESCTANNNSAASACVSAPGGGTLKRYEIKSGQSFPSGRSHADELQNFANWWQYYRKRVHSLAGSMGTVMENLNGLRLGVVNFNNRVPVTMFDADATQPGSNKLAVAGRFYTNPANASTPTRETLDYIGQQFHTNTSVVQYACQRNAAFIVTDGFANASSPAVVPPAYNRATWGSGAPYATTSDNSLADVALSYYTTRLRGTAFAAGRLPLGNQNVQNPDANPDLHMNTYAIMMGIKGTIWPDISDAWAQPITWPIVTASGDRAAIDDLWHATLNGRGKMYLATSPEETAASIRAGLNDILDQQAAQGGVAVTTVNLGRGDGRAYVATYNPAGWTGDLQAVSVNQNTGVLGTTAIWSVAQQLGDRTEPRVILSWNGSAGVAFTATGVGSQVNPGGNTWGDTNELMAYLRGDRSFEGSKFRLRRGLVGAVINAEPAVDRETNTAFFASGEGMLHAVEMAGASAGKELWAYVPGANLQDMGQTASRSYSFKTQLDGTPVLRKLPDGTRLLVAGMGVAGRAYYALDVTAPRDITEASTDKVKWEFPRASDSAETKAKLGQTLGKPAIVRLANGTAAVLVTSGYNSTHDGRGRLWVLNAETGAPLAHKEYVTPDGTLANESGLAHISPLAEADGTVRHVYAGDLLGNVWRFDLNLDASATGAVTKIAQLRGPAGTADVQPVTTPPELLQVNGQRIVFVGTGRLLDISDFGSSAVQSLYAIKDGSLLANARSSLLPRTLNLAANNGNGSITGTAVNWATDRGWYVDLPSGEQVNTRPTIVYGALAFIANKTGATDCSASSRMYVIDALSGGAFASAGFVTAVFSSTSNASALTALLSADGKTLRFLARDFNTGSSDGKDVSAGVPIAPAKNAWHEVRR